MKKAAEYFVTFILIQFVSLTLANGAVILSGGQIGDNPASAAIGMNVATFILVLAVFILWFRSVSLNADYLKSGRWVQLALCAILGIATISPSLFIEQLTPGVIDTNKELFTSMIASPMGFIALVFLGPITEEIVFRGAILKALSISTQNKWIAIGVSASLFAIIHFNPAQLLHTFLIGILLGWVCIKTKSIVPCILIHIINNGTVYLFIKYMPEASLTSVPLLITSVLLIIISLLGIIKSTRQ